jgi:hypothetical protein
MSWRFFPSALVSVVGVGHPVEALSDVRCTDARSAQIGSPAGVTRSFQVSLYKVEPLKAVFARNLLAKDDGRAALADEPVECGPKVPLVSKPSAFACRGERLTRAATCPHGSVVRPSSKSQSSRPNADAGKKVTLSESMKFDGVNVFNRALIDDSVSDVPSFD